MTTEASAVDRVAQALRVQCPGLSWSNVTVAAVVLAALREDAVGRVAAMIREDRGVVRDSGWNYDKCSKRAAEIVAALLGDES